MKTILLILTVGIFMLQAVFAQAPGDQNEAMPYTFEAPDAVFALPRSLVEVSGLTVLDDRHLGAVQDEKGILFVLDIETGAVVEEKKFGKKGDYEGVERVGDNLYALRSDGRLYRIENWRADDLEAEKIETGLSQKYDTEGLAYDAARRWLLIACKEYPGKDLKGNRAIYAYDLATRTMIDGPVIVVPLDVVNATEKSSLNRTIRSLLSPVADLSGFKPSALAVHPLSGQLYLLSSVRKLIVVLHHDGPVEAIWKLPDSLFAQPEGMTFLPNGDLFIANEGQDDRATLLRFNYRGSE